MVADAGTCCCRCCSGLRDVTIFLGIMSLLLLLLLPLLLPAAAAADTVTCLWLAKPPTLQGVLSGQITLILEGNIH